MQFQRGPYSDGFGSRLGGGSSPVTVRTLVQGDKELDDRLEKLMAKATPDAPKEVCLEVLSEVAGIPSANLPQFIGGLLAHPDPEVRGRALVELEGIADDGVLPVVEQAMADAEPDVRLQALEVLDRGGVPEARETLVKGLNDPDLNVRQLAFQVGLAQPPQVRQQLLGEAAQSRFPDLAIAALSVMDSEPDKRNVPSFIGALDHREADVRELARDTLGLTFHEVFESSAEARAWWSSNQRRYSQELVEDVLLPAPPSGANP